MKRPFTLVMLSLAMLLTNVAYAGVPKLNSLISAQPLPTIFLDFDGSFVQNSAWNNGTPFTCAAAVLSDPQITEIFNRVAEDFRPFALNVTTDSTKFLAAPISQRVRIIITPTSSWYPYNVGGISYIGSFTYGDDTPAFVFTDKLATIPSVSILKLIAEASSHETGHTLYLSHQSKWTAGCSLDEEYHTGIGLGENAWAPVMGASYYRNMSNWSDGPTPWGCANTQDNLTIITTQNGFGYRADDYGQVMNATTTTLNPVNVNTSGIITTSADKDAFKIVFTSGATFHFTLKPFNVGTGDEGADVDLKLTIYNAAGVLLKTYDPAATMGVTIDSNFASGNYYFLVDGTGNVNVGDYGSLGSYTMTGFTGPLPIHDVALNGNSDKAKHNLNWNIVADEPIKTVEVEVSADGSNFHLLTSTSGTAKNFSYVPFEKSDLYYRLKATSVINQSLYSNTIVLRGVTKAADAFSVSTLVHDRISVNASENYQYVLTDMNGRVVGKGNGTRGVNNVNIDNQPGGMYIMQIVSNNVKQTERIVKQ